MTGSYCRSENLHPSLSREIFFTLSAVASRSNMIFPLTGGETYNAGSVVLDHRLRVPIATRNTLDSRLCTLSAYRDVPHDIPRKLQLQLRYSYITSCVNQPSGSRPVLGMHSTRARIKFWGGVNLDSQPAWGFSDRDFERFNGASKLDCQSPRWV